MNGDRRVAVKAVGAPADPPAEIGLGRREHVVPREQEVAPVVGGESGRGEPDAPPDRIPAERAISRTRPSRPRRHEVPRLHVRQEHADDRQVGLLAVEIVVGVERGVHGGVGRDAGIRSADTRSEYRPKRGVSSAKSARGGAALIWPVPRASPQNRKNALCPEKTLDMTGVSCQFLVVVFS